MRGKVLSWVLLFVTVFFAVQALMWSASDRSWNVTWLIVYCFCALAAGVWTTLLSPREPIYDLVRYFLMAALAWMAYHENIAVMVGIIVLAVLFLPSVRQDFKGKDKEKRDQFVEKLFVRYVDKRTDGIMFERQCAEYLRRLGYSHVRMTRTTGDFGADLTAYDKHGNKWVFQCKRYSGGVGVAAVQQAVAAKAHYGATYGGVMTNSHMTDAAKQLAWENAIEIMEGLSD